MYTFIEDLSVKLNLPSNIKLRRFNEQVLIFGNNKEPDLIEINYLEFNSINDLADQINRELDSIRLSGLY